MATEPPIKEDRDANLDDLRTQVTDWAEKEQRRLENESKFLQAVLLGRGASNTGTENLSAVSKLVIDEINRFIVKTT